MRVAAAIEKKLNAEFNPVRLSVVDESHKHKGHAGARPEGESHFQVEIVSADFEGLSRLDRQRKIYAALARHGFDYDIISSLLTEEDDL